MHVLMFVVLATAWLVACGFLLRWYTSRPAVQSDLDKLSAATEAAKVEIGTALLPAMRKISEAAAKMSRTLP